MKINEYAALLYGFAAVLFAIAFLVILYAITAYNTVPLCR
jgi:hypothetical protein